MDANAIAIRDMTVFDRRGNLLLQVPEFTLTHGEICGVYGASVQGSNLFLNCVSGLVRPNEGRISIYGHALRASALNTQPIGVLPRTGGLFPEFTAGENLKLALQFSLCGRLTRAGRVERLQRVTGLLDLDSWARTPAKQLPGGVRQRLGLACALIHEPRLLVADDPWGRADVESRGLIDRAIGDHCSRGNTLLFASPRESEIISFASEICLFDRTHVIARGTLDHLRQRLVAEETIVIRIQDGASRLAERASRLPGVVSCQATERTVTMQAQPGSIRLTRLAEHVQTLGLELLDMHVQKPGLREIYAAVARTAGTNEERQ